MTVVAVLVEIRVVESTREVAATSMATVEGRRDPCGQPSDARCPALMHSSHLARSLAGLYGRDIFPVKNLLFAQVTIMSMFLTP